MKTGNALESARLAGYKSPHPTGARLLQNATIKEAIEARVNEDPEVWDRRKLLSFWTEMAQSAEGDNNRLKASEYLAKAQAMFVQKMEVQHNFQNKSDDEVLADVIADLRERGYKVVPPK
jgi:phage terminase small subunit